MTRPALVLAPGQVLAGCSPEEAPVPDTCGAAGMQELVGQSRDALAAMTLPQGTRVIEPGMAVTGDLRQDRLNLDIDAQGRIARVRCS
ncbi:MAG: I78 family peptidase inhibitor [Tabrizicola sp.]